MRSYSGRKYRICFSALRFTFYYSTRNDCVVFEVYVLCALVLMVCGNCGLTKRVIIVNVNENLGNQL
jgi:hypothetical protein